MKKSKPYGIIVPTITPFKSNEEQDLDEEALRELVRYLLKSGVHGIFPCGGTGEFPLLSEEEHKKVIEIVIDEVKGKIPVIPGAGNAGTRNALRLAKLARDAGADAVVVLTPWFYSYNLIGYEGLYEHYKTIARGANLPVILYDEPPVCGYDIDPGLLARLADEANVVGIKEASHSLAHASQVIKTCGDKVTLISADGAQLLPHLIIGARANITAANNVAPKLFVELFESFMKGNIQRAREIYQDLIPLFSLCGPPANVKEALNMMGMSVGIPRKPLKPATKETKTKLKQVLKDLKLI